MPWTSDLANAVAEVVGERRDLMAAERNNFDDADLGEYRAAVRIALEQLHDVLARCPADVSEDDIRAMGGG